MYKRKAEKKFRADKKPKAEKSYGGKNPRAEKIPRRKNPLNDDKQKNSLCNNIIRIQIDLGKTLKPLQLNLRNPMRLPIFFQ